jgi:hypothetical protein
MQFQHQRGMLSESLAKPGLFAYFVRGYPIEHSMPFDRDTT